MADFLHYFPQYRLEDLRDGSLPYGDFHWLLLGMLDTVDPEVTEPAAERVSRAVMEMAKRALARKRGKRGL